MIRLDPKTIAIGAGVVGAAVGGIALLRAYAVSQAGASARRALGGGGTPATQAVGGAPWLVTQGHRYLVKLSSAAVNFSGITTRDASTLNLQLPVGFLIVPGSITSDVAAGPGFAQYLVDFTGATHNEPAATFLLGVNVPSGTPVNVSVGDVGPIPGLAGAKGPSGAPAPPPLPPMPTMPGGAATPPPGGAPTTPQPLPPAAVPPTPPVPSSAFAPPPPWEPTIDQQPIAPTWAASDTVSFLQRVRWSIAVADANAFLSSQGVSSSGSVRDALGKALQSGSPAAKLQSNIFQVWDVGESLPADWPYDEPHGKDGLHVELVYGVGAIAAGTPPAPLSKTDVFQFGLLLSAQWVDSGPFPSRARPAPGTIPPPLTWTKTTTLQPGAHIRMSALPGAFRQVVPPNFAFGTLGDVDCLTFLNWANAAGVTVGSSAGLLAWCVGDPIPPDWPADDTQALGEVHIEFRFAPTATATTLPSGFPFQAWSGA